MDEPPKIQLDYSSPEEEQAREKRLEDARREALDNYNESTYGVRHPFANVFMWIAVAAAAFGVIFYFFPQSVADPLAFCTILLIAGVKYMRTR